MKIVFYSTNRLEVELLGRELLEAGIPCRIRNGVHLEKLPPHVPEVELWIRNDRDAHRAFMLCVQRDAGFAKRAPSTCAFEDLFPEAERLKPDLAA